MIIIELDLNKDTKKCNKAFNNDDIDKETVYDS